MEPIPIKFSQETTLKAQPYSQQNSQSTTDSSNGSANLNYHSPKANTFGASTSNNLYAEDDHGHNDFIKKFFNKMKMKAGMAEEESQKFTFGKSTFGN